MAEFVDEDNFCKRFQKLRQNVNLNVSYIFGRWSKHKRDRMII